MTIALVVYGLVDREAGWGVVMMSLATLGSLGASATMWFGYLPTGWFFVGPFSFRVAAEATGARHLRRSLVQLVVFWTTFFVVVPLALMVVEERLHLSWSGLDQKGVRLVGAAAFIVGSAVGLWSCVTMALRGKGTPLPAESARELVITGPYRFVRNPMAVAGFMQTAGIGLLVGSWMVIVTAVAGALVWNVLIRPTEEADLADRFGEGYRKYGVPELPSSARRTPRSGIGARQAPLVVADVWSQAGHRGWGRVGATESGTDPASGHGVLGVEGVAVGRGARTVHGARRRADDGIGDRRSARVAPAQPL